MWGDFIGVVLNGKYGFIDKTGKQVIPCVYDYVYSIEREFAKVRLNDKYGFINKAGQLIVPCNYDEVYYGYSDELIKVVFGKYDDPNRKYGLFDKTGKTIIPCYCDEIDRFENGLARVKIAGKWMGYIDETGTQYWED